MLTLQQSLELPRRLPGAERQLLAWSRHRPGLLGVESLEQLEAATRDRQADESDLVFRALAELASRDGGDSPDAAVLLCHLLIPAAVPTLRVGAQGARDVSRDDVTTLVAEQLWIAARTFPWRTNRKVAVSIRWTVRRAVLGELGFAHHLLRVDRTWSATLQVSEEHIDRWPADTQPPSERELDDLLGRALRSGVVNRPDIELLWALVTESDRADGRYTSCGLLSEPVTRVVGARLGVTSRTVRRRASTALAALRVLAMSDAFADLQAAA